MRVHVGAGTYVVAVSGGVDSMVLLDILRQRPGLRLIVAHFDHGIRSDSHKDRQLVQDVAKRYGLQFVYHTGKLGSKTSEAAARAARYKFLHQVRKASGAKAIVTAHHQDDWLETALLNMLRGTGRRGLTSLKSTDGIIRPLLDYDKQRIYDYAHNHKIGWREDITNLDTAYRRNHVRHNLMPKLSSGQRAQLVILLNELLATNQELDIHMINLLHMQPASDTLDRNWFIALPHDVAREVMHAWLRYRASSDVTRAGIERLVVAGKTAKTAKRIDVDKNLQLVVHARQITLKKRPKPAKHRSKKRISTKT